MVRAVSSNTSGVMGPTSSRPNRRLISPCACGPPTSRSRATASTAASSASRPTTRCTRPMASAWAAPMRSVLSASRSAWRRPTALTRWGPITDGRMPNLASLTEKLALSAATAMSQAQVRPTPPPSAAPCTRATVGLGSAAMRASMPAKRRASCRFQSSLARLARCIHCRSAPALKCRPSPASTTTRTAGSAASAAKAASSSPIMVSSKALNTAGRDIVICATPGARVLRFRVW